MHFTKLIALLAIFLVLTRPLPGEEPATQAMNSGPAASIGLTD